jgi:hypothetical protein
MIALPVLFALLHLAAPQQLPCDLEAYIEEIKQAGATEGAKGSIDMVVSIMVGDELLEFPKNSETGEYGNSYRSASCLKPGLSNSTLLRINH